MAYFRSAAYVMLVRLGLYVSHTCDVEMSELLSLPTKLNGLNIIQVIGNGTI